MTNGQSEPYPNRKRPGKNKIRTINKNQSHYVYFFCCRVISHMYIVISLKRLQNAETINNKKKLEIYTQICKRNGTNSQHEKNILSNIACVPYYSLMFLIRVLKKVCFV